MNYDLTAHQGPIDSASLRLLRETIEMVPHVYIDLIGGRPAFFDLRSREALAFIVDRRPSSVLWRARGWAEHLEALRRKAAEART